MCAMLSFMETDLREEKKVIGVIMTYNCAKLLEGAYRRIPKELFSELICVDDGSTDASAAVAEGLRLPTFTHPHTGYGGNLLFGLRKAIERGATHMVEIHGDGQYDIAQGMPLALQKFDEGCDLLFGNRFFDLRQPLRDGMSFIQYSGNLFLTVLARIGTGIPLPDFFPGFRAYSKRFVEALDFSKNSKDYFFSFQIIVQARYRGLKLCHVPVRCDNSREHTSISVIKGLWAIFQTSGAILLYWLARCGIRRGIFS